MGLLELFFSLYFILLLIRAVIPNTGQMPFNQPYRLIVRLTEPVVSNLARLLPSRSSGTATLIGIFLLVMLQGLLYSGDTGFGSSTFTCGLSRWRFTTGVPFWGLGKGLVHYLLLIYRFYMLLLIISLISPLTAATDQVSRLVKQIIQPLLKRARGKTQLGIVVPLLFSVILAALWKFYQVMGWISGERMIMVKALLNSLALIVQLFTVIIYLIVIRAVLSWFPASRGRGPLLWLEHFSEPFIRPFRRLKLSLKTIDLTPLAAIFVIIIMQRILLSVLGSIYTTLPGG